MEKISTFFSNEPGQQVKPARFLLLFGLFWTLLFVLYFPAAKAGFVTDFTGWLDQVKNFSFSEFINRTHFKARSMYQLTQFNTWVFYKLLGVNPWLWHILFISLHAVNGVLLYKLCAGLLGDAGARNGNITALAGALLFCVSPYMSEVIVWEPSFHFLQGLLLILLVLICVQRYMQTGAPMYAWWAAAVYFLSLFSLEIFYITPWLVLTLALFYSSVSAKHKSKFRGAVLYFFVPMLLLFVVRFIVYRLYAGDWVSRIGSGAVSMVSFESFSKPAKHLFNLVFVGRFMPADFRHNVYELCDSALGIAGFYCGLLAALGYIVWAFKTMNGKLRVASLLFVWLVISLLLLIPLWFQADMVVGYDRYLYFAGAFFYMFCAVLASLIAIKYLGLAILGLYALVNLRFAIQANGFWARSEHIVHNLLHSLPDDRSKTMILLNLPQCMYGVPMIGAEKNSEYKLMHDLLVPGKPLTNTVYDVFAYNMNTAYDGAHVYVVNDSLIKVTLNQWATWWWFETRGANSYWTSDYKLDLKDPGHWYEITLRKPADKYLILFCVGDKWKVVDMNKKGVDQE